MVNFLKSVEAQSGGTPYASRQVNRLGRSTAVPEVYPPSDEIKACKHGHLLTPENLLPYASAGDRCRQCARANHRARHDKMRLRGFPCCTVEDCELPRHYRGGLCYRHARGSARLANQPEAPASDPVSRFWQRVERTDTCWLWKGEAGRGRYWSIAGASIGRVPVHRFSYEIHKGPIPEGMQVDHLCRTPNCVNPAHLEAVPQRVNCLRGVGPTAQNARRTHCVNGHPFDNANTYRRLGTSARACKECTRLAGKRWRAKKAKAGVLK
jgi:hypothetical protein